MIDDFVVFILSHGRPDNVITYKTLRKRGYTGSIYIIIDNEDETADRYYENYGDQVIMFDRVSGADATDAFDNFERKSVVWARNACFDIAQDLGATYFLELDDDYTSFCYKFDSGLNYKELQCRRLDDLFEIILEFYKSIPALTITLAQGGDFIGGGASSFGKQIVLARKAMNTFFCSTERPFRFVGQMNDDVNTYSSIGNRGGLFLMITNAMIHQLATQENSGGLTDMYLTYGTYVKSLYTVMACPSFVDVYEMGEKNRRIHHRISWNNAVPKILHERYRKGYTRQVI